jgi:hypothetical protein
VYLLWTPGGGPSSFGAAALRALPGAKGGATRVVYADRCAVDEEELAAGGIVFRKIPRDMRELMSRVGKEGGR